MEMRRGQIVDEIDFLLPNADSLATYLAHKCYDRGRPSLTARDAISASWDNMTNEVARIVEADQAGTLDEYLRGKE